MKPGITLPRHGRIPSSNLGWSIIKMENCIFCKIIKEEIPAEKIYEDDSTLAFLDISPVNKGHALVIPKEHHETITEIPEELLKNTISTVQKIAKAVENISDGINIMQNNKEIAGQVVPHVHFHIIPRLKDDGFKLNWRHTEYQKNEIKEFSKKIKSFL